MYYSTFCNDGHDEEHQIWVIGEILYFTVFGRNLDTFVKDTIEMFSTHELSRICLTLHRVHH